MVAINGFGAISVSRICSFAPPGFAPKVTISAVARAAYSRYTATFQVGFCRTPPPLRPGSAYRRRRLPQGSVVYRSRLLPPHRGTVLPQYHHSPYIAVTRSSMYCTGPVACLEHWPGALSGDRLPAVCTAARPHAASGGMPQPGMPQPSIDLRRLTEAGALTCRCALL
jgi:hypothetical protein